MDITIAKYFIVVVCAIFLYVKFINYKKMSLLKIIAALLFSCTVSIALFLLPLCPEYLKFAGAILSSALFMTTVTRTKIEMSFTVSVISFMLSYTLTFAAFVAASIIARIFLATTNLLIAALVSAIINGVILHMLFRIKRLRKGLQFLQKEGTGGIGITMSGIIFVCMAIAANRSVSNVTAGALCLGAMICAIGIFRWWRSELTKLYISNLQKSTIEELKTLLHQKDTEIEKIRKENAFIGAMIHRDNKLFPAMALTVTRFIEQHAQNDTMRQEGDILLKQLSNSMTERTTQIVTNKNMHKKLPSTNIPLIDSTLQYFQLKAADNGIEFDVLITGSIRHMTETVVTTSPLQTMLADHIENAIIAAKHCERRKILVTLGIGDDTVYELSIRDSGVPFEVQTLLSLGAHKTTTHENDGGQGIGFMTTFAILQKAGASLHIHEYENHPGGFSKSVAIRFDAKNQFEIVSYRADAIRNALDENESRGLILLRN